MVVYKLINAVNCELWMPQILFMNGTKRFTNGKEHLFQLMNALWMAQTDLWLGTAVRFK